MKAIIADIHGNLAALRAVLDDSAVHDVHEIYCLGDMVGYGPNPCECVDLLMSCDVALLGNHDLAATRDDPLRGLELQRHMIWTRRQLARPAPDDNTSNRRREFLAHLPITHRDGEYLFLHGGPREPVHEFVFPEDIHNARKLRAIFALVDRYCFMGHTHIPGIFTEDHRFISPEEASGQWQLGSRKTLVNVGSVGQPRDSDPRACYVLLDGATVRFRRVDYDIDGTIARMYRIDDFPTE
jgi:diadenosine tetraphosphatase ApaH/serine/threonine PP2A family protein phosphatase